MTEDQERLAVTHLPLVRSIATGMAGSWPPHVRLDELVSAGSLGLVQAARSFDPAYGLPFGLWARQRIVGAILDHARHMDWAPRSVRRFARDNDDVTSRLIAIQHQAPASQGIADALGLSSRQLADQRARLIRAELLSLDTLSIDPDDHDLTLGDLIVDPAAGPFDQFEQAELVGYLHTAIAVLPDRLRFVVDEVLFAGRPRIEVADELGVTESRIAQMIQETVALLRVGIEAQYPPGMFGEPTPPADHPRVARRRADYAQAITDAWAHQCDFPSKRFTGNVTPVRGLARTAA